MAEKLISGHIRKHSKGTYYIVLSIPQQEGGTKPKWIPTGLKVERGSKKKADAMLQEARREYTEKLNQETPVGNDMLFADYMIFWLSVVKPELKATTYSGYYGNIHSVIAPYFRDHGITLKDLTSEDIDEFYCEQLLRVKPNTVLRYHANIHKALRYAAKKKDRPYYKPFFMEEVEKPTPNSFQARFLNESKVVELVKAAAGTDLVLPIMMGAYCGLRRGEAYGLRWSCIDFEKDFILINHTVVKQKVNGKYQFLFQTPKTAASIRALPLDPVMKQYLQLKKKEQESYKKMFGKTYCKDYLDYVNVNPLGELLNPNNVTKRFADFTERLGFGRMRFHDLRHTCASIMIARGLSMKQVQEWLGHSDYKITANTYSHLEYASKIAASKQMTWTQDVAYAILGGEGNMGATA